MAIAVAKKASSDYYELSIVDEKIINHFKSLPEDYWNCVSYEKNIPIPYILIQQ